MTHAFRTRKALPYLFSCLSPCRIVVVAFAYLLALHDEKSFVLSHPRQCMYRIGSGLVGGVVWDLRVCETVCANFGPKTFETWHQVGWKSSDRARMSVPNVPILSLLL